MIFFFKRNEIVLYLKWNDWDFRDMNIYIFVSDSYWMIFKMVNKIYIRFSLKIMLEEYFFFKYENCIFKYNIFLLIFFRFVKINKFYLFLE